MKKTKVCMLLGNPLLYDNRCYRQAIALKEVGYGVTVLAPKANMELPTREERDGIKIIRILKWWLPYIPLNRGELYESLLYLKHAIVEKADIYQANDVDTLGYAFVASMWNGSKLVYDSREYWHSLKIPDYRFIREFTRNFYIKHFERLFTWRANAIFTVNDEIAIRMKKVLWLKDKPSVIMNTPDRTKILKNKRLRRDCGFENKKIAIYVGGFMEGRGLEVLIDSAKLLPDDIKVVLLGYGELEKELKRQVVRNKLKERVKILPPVPYKELLNYISDADVAVHPILPVMENHLLCLPNKFFEYTLAGLPMVVSDLPVLGSMVKKYKIGLAIDSGDPRILAEAIVKLLSDKKQYAIYKKNTLLAAEKLNWEEEKKKYLEIYERVSAN